MTSMSALRATVDELNAVIDATPFLKPYRLTVTGCVSGACSVLVPFDKDLERPGGIVSGMTLMGAADVAMWLAIMTVRGTGEHWVTTDMKTAFLKSARSEDVVCSAQVLKLGRRTAYGTAECRSAEAGLLAHHVLSYAAVLS